MLLANNACMGNETCTVLCHVCAATTQYNVKTPPSLPPSLTILSAGHNEFDGAKIRTEVPSLQVGSTSGLLSLREREKSLLLTRTRVSHADMCHAQRHTR